MNPAQVQQLSAQSMQIRAQAGRFSPIQASPQCSHAWAQRTHASMHV
jgi:hypothetical protein